MFDGLIILKALSHVIMVISKQTNKQKTTTTTRNKKTNKQTKNKKTKNKQTNKKNPTISRLISKSK